MKILTTGDLRFREHWFLWLLEQAKNYDLVCLAGDLLDMFRGEARTVQAREVSRWIRQLGKFTRVALCSGNHDNAGRQTSPDRVSVYEWLITLGEEPKIVSDGLTQVVSDLIVTNVPYHCSKEEKSVLMDRGGIIRQQRGGPWVVLHHIPPIAYPDSSKEEAEAAQLLQIYQPDYFVSGHSHQLPYFPGSTWSQRVGGVTVLASGQLLNAPFPNHIVLDSVSGEASWETASREWISEDGSCEKNSIS